MVNSKKIILICFLSFFVIIVVVYAIYLNVVNNEKQIDEMKILTNHKLMVGTLEDVKESEMTIKIDNSSPISTIKEDDFIYKKFIINSKTEILKLTNEIKSEEQFIKEQNFINNKIKHLKSQNKNINNIEGASWHKEELFGINELLKGDVVKILYLEENSVLMAKKITVQLALEKNNSSLLEMNNEILTDYGKIIQIENNTLKLGVINESPNANSEFRATKNYILTDNIKVILKIKKSEEIFYKELEGFDSKNNKFDGPSWYLEEDLIFGDFLLNKNVQIFSKINQRGEFEIIKVEIY